VAAYYGCFMHTPSMGEVEFIERGLILVDASGLITHVLTESDS